VKSSNEYLSVLTAQRHCRDFLPHLKPQHLRPRPEDLKAKIKANLRKSSKAASLGKS